MKALTVCQPWAHAILHLGKDVENRTWATTYRGPLFIHAGKSRRFRCELRGLPPWDSLVFGALVGVVEVVGCVSFDELKDGSLFERRSEWAEGPWCWLLRNPRAFDPIPYRGSMSLFDVPDGLVRDPAKYLMHHFN
jgi:hypothetical protein